ncbi:MAG TPA: iron ABC transporter permease [Candidatus Latescibacteria bacterium]|nr:iron ABC transporter permease [Candidatus Latescibacterota bacterium]
MGSKTLTPASAVFLVLLFGVFAVFLVYPVGYVLESAFYREGVFTLEFFRLMFTNPVHREAIINSTMLAITVTAVTTVIALPISFVMVRRDFPGKPLLNGLLLVPMVMPPFVGAVGMQQLLAKFGSVNLLLIRIGLMSPRDPFDWLGTGFWAVVLLSVLHLYPIMYLNVAAALANVDPSLEEAGRNMGASGFKLFRSVTFPLMLPGYFAGAIIVFIWAFTDLGTPLIFNYSRVVPVRIFEAVSDIHENPMGFALVVLVLAMTVVFFAISKKVLGSSNYQMMARGHVQGSSSPLPRRWVPVVWVSIAAVIGCALIPHASVVLSAIADTWFMTILPSSYTTVYIGRVFTHPLTLSSIRNSLFLSSLSTVVDVALGVTIAYFLARKRFIGRDVLDGLAMLPLALPGLVLAFGYVAAFSGSFLDIKRNPMPLLIIAYAIRRLPYMVRAAYAGLQQTSETLEEASLNLGAGPLRTLRRITLPLVFANIVAGSVLAFSFAMLEVSDSLILAAKEEFYPITKAIYAMSLRVADGPYIASAMGLLGMVLLATSLIVAGRFLGKRLGELFRA